MYKFRFSLRSILLVVVIVSIVLGVVARRPTFVARNRVCDGYVVKGMWRMEFGFRETPVVFVAYPRTGFSFTHVHPFGNDPSSEAFTIFGGGLCVDGQLLTSSDGERFWLYLPEGRHGTAVPIPQTAGSVSRISVADFDRLEFSPIWKQVRPALEEASKMYEPHNETGPLFHSVKRKRDAG